LPASDRCREQTKKQPTGKFDRNKLLRFLEDQGKNEKDWEKNKEFVKEVRGKVWQPPPKPVLDESQMDLSSGLSGGTGESEWDEILNGATEAEIVELAAILGFTGMVNQVQFYAALKTDGDSQHVAVGGGWSAAAKSEPLKLVPNEPDNQTDVDASIDQVEADDESLTTLNLNNIKNISYEKMKRLIEAMKTNTNVKILCMSNIDMPDSVAKVN
jgi:tropomodulin